MSPNEYKKQLSKLKEEIEGAVSPFEKLAADFQRQWKRQVAFHANARRFETAVRQAEQLRQTYVRRAKERAAEIPKLRCEELMVHLDCLVQEHREVADEDLLLERIVAAYTEGRYGWAISQIEMVVAVLDRRPMAGEASINWTPDPLPPDPKS
jgi:hypothetical protein